MLLSTQLAIPYGNRIFHPRHPAGRYWPESGRWSEKTTKDGILFEVLRLFDILYAQIWTCYIPVEAEFIREQSLYYKKPVRPTVRTLLAGKWTQFRKNAQKSPFFQGFWIICHTSLHGIELKFYTKVDGDRRHVHSKF